MGMVGGRPVKATAVEPYVLCLTCKEKVPLKAILRGTTARVLVCPSCLRDNAVQPHSLTSSTV